MTDRPRTFEEVVGAEGPAEQERFDRAKHYLRLLEVARRALRCARFNSIGSIVVLILSLLTRVEIGHREKGPHQIAWVRLVTKHLSSRLFSAATQRHLKAGETLFVAGDYGDGCQRRVDASHAPPLALRSSWD
jgi:hypothetical protein